LIKISSSVYALAFHLSYIRLSISEESSSSISLLCISTTSSNAT
jgi:hypothetical protein